MLTAATRAAPYLCSGRRLFPPGAAIARPPHPGSRAKAAWRLRSEARRRSVIEVLGSSLSGAGADGTSIGRASARRHHIGAVDRSRSGPGDRGRKLRSPHGSGDTKRDSAPAVAGEREMTKARVVGGAFSVALFLLALVFVVRHRTVAPPPASRAEEAGSTARAAAEKMEERDARGFLHGRITTLTGATWEGRLRFGGDQEAF